MTEKKSQMHGRAIKIVFPQEDPTKPAHEELVVQVAIDCPDCGKVQTVIPGHHLRALHQLLGQFLEEFPSTHLSGDLGELTEQFSFTGGGGQKPQNN